MTLIQRHYIREFSKLFALLLAGFSLTFSLFGLVQRLDDFMPHKPSLLRLAEYAFLKSPQYALSLMPVACLLCGLYTVANASRAREIVAVMAAGGRVKKLLGPFLAVGLLLSLLAFMLGEFVVPPAMTRAEELKDALSGAEGGAPALMKEGVLWFRAEDGSIIRIENYVPAADTYAGVSVFRLKDGELAEIVEAREALWLKDPGTWRLDDVRRYFPAEGASESLDEYLYAGLGPPELLKETAQEPSEMGIAELYRYLKRLKEAGFKNLRLSVDFHSKVSYPVINFIMVVIGVSIAVRRRMGGFVATAIGLLISLAYWFGFTMSLSLGYAGVLPPLVAAWLMPLAAGAAGFYLFRKIPE